MKSAFPAATVEGSAKRLTVKGDNLTGQLRDEVLNYLRDALTEHLWVERFENTAISILRRYAIRQFEEGSQPSFAGASENLHVRPAVRAIDEREQRDDEDVD